MTPEEARELLIQAKCEQNTHKGYLDALHLVSGMRYEYAVARRDSGIQVTKWAPEEPLFPGQSIGENELIVRRLVSEPEVIK